VIRSSSLGTCFPVPRMRVLIFLKSSKRQKVNPSSHSPMQVAKLNLFSHLRCSDRRTNRYPTGSPFAPISWDTSSSCQNVP
jgi:hypothetical protein